MTVTSAPSAIDYTSLDFAGFRESMITYAALIAPEWRGAQTSDPNDFGVALLEVFAYEGDILSYYGDRIANESLLTTATQRSSVLAHAALLDYTPRTATAASVTVTITVSTTDEVTIPAGFQVQSAPDGTGTTLTYETSVDLVFPAGTNSLDVVANEGVTVADEVVATSCGDLDASWTLAQTPVVADSVVVRIVEAPLDAGQVWTPVSNLLDAGPFDNAYSISLDENDSLTLHFGDGVNGRVPPRNAVVHATYRTGGGEDGNVLAGAITQVVDPTDYVFTTADPQTTPPPSITLINTEDAAGGTDSESLDSIRENAPRALRARQRAVSLEDYEALALTVPSVLIAKAKAVAAVYTNVTLYVAPPGGQQPSQDTLNAVVAYFDTRKLANVTVVAANPTYVSVDIELLIEIDDRYSQVFVKQAVRNAMQALLAFDNVSFGGRVTLSSIYNVAARVEGVSNVVVSKLARNGGTPVAQDIILRDHELPLAGRVTLVANGGLTNTYITDDVLGSEDSTVTPGASTAPEIGVIRCDPNSTHVELTWTSGTDTSYWDVLVLYINAANEVVQSTVTGPYDRPQAELDLPYIGAGRASKIRFLTRAYNSSAGPVESPPTTVDYTCEGTVTSTPTDPTTPPGTPNIGGISNTVDPPLVTGDPTQVSAQGDVEFTTTNTSNVAIEFDFLDSGMNVIYTATPIGGIIPDTDGDTLYHFSGVQGPASAEYIRLRLQAYNGALGPVFSNYALSGLH